MILHLLCTNTAVNMAKVVIKILQGSAVTQTVQGGLIIHYLVANFLQYISAKNYEKQLTYANTKRAFFATQCILSSHDLNHVILHLATDGSRLS